MPQKVAGVKGEEMYMPVKRWAHGRPVSVCLLPDYSFGHGRMSVSKLRCNIVTRTSL